MTENVVFLGNCQIAIMSRLYKKLRADAEVAVSYIASYRSASDREKALIAGADILVRQVTDFIPAVGDIVTDAKIVLVPHLTAAFLWPCSGEPHPLNATCQTGDFAGPYPREIGDTFLNKSIQQGMDADEAVTRYLDTNLAALRHVGRMAEIMIEKQRTRDELCGYAFADDIASRYRTERLFHTANHPSRSLVVRLATDLFTRMGFSGADVATIPSLLPPHAHPDAAAPLHPSIIEHFNLTWATAATRYRYFDEGAFTWTEFAGRYVRFTWNAKLRQGFSLAQAGDHDNAIAVLHSALQVSPDSARGHSVLSHCLAVRGRLTEALQSAARAFALDNTNERYGRQVDHLRQRLRTSGLGPALTEPAASGADFAASDETLAM
jgi:hypothetical protein